MTVHTRYSAIVADVKGDIGQWAWGENDLSSLESRIKEFKKMLVEVFDEH